jgi:hypothetical protein
MNGAARTRSRAPVRARALGLALALALALPSAAQHTVTRHTVDGGGARSSSVRYVVIGSIGQPDAHGLLFGPTYRAAGGYWAVLPVDALFSDGFEDPEPPP